MIMIELVVADPWELAGHKLLATILETSEDRVRVLVSVDPPPSFAGNDYPYAVLKRRDGGPFLLEPRGSGIVDFSAIGLLSRPAVKAFAVESDTWRGGGLAFTSSLT